MLNFKKLLFLLILFYSSFYASAKLNYANYHLHTNRAEWMISENKLKSALLIYEDVFKKYNNHFFKDINNAFYCCIGLKEYKKAKFYAEELVLHGYQWSDFEKKELAAFKRTKEWKKFSKEYSNLKKKYEEGVNKELRKKYEEIYKIDQKAAQSDDVSNMHETYFKQACLLSKLFSEHGFKNLGINKDGKDYHIYAVLRHYCNLVNQMNAWPDLFTAEIYKQMDIKKIPLLKQFKIAVLEGKVLPELYSSAIIYGDDSRKNEYGEILVMVNFSTKEKSLYSYASKEKLELINQRRLKIGLFPIKKTSNNVLESTWYKYYPFDSIIDLLKDSNEKKLTGKLMGKMGKIELKVREQYNTDKESSNFFLSDQNNIKGVCYSGYQSYLKK